MQMIQVTRFDAAKPYDAKGHHGMTAMRIQGQGVSDLEDYWVGFSTFLPGGGAEQSSAPTGKVYVILEGELTVVCGTQETVLGKFDSCFIPPNTERSIVNKTNNVVQMLVVSP
jgi:mannose-6-phosphate isomerase-like protein (cupin superfamily)